MALSKRRQQEIRDLATPGVPPGTPEEFWNDDAALAPIIRAADQKRKAWLKESTDPKELHFFAENWHWDTGDGKQLYPLVDNPHCDAGTMMMLFWRGAGEDSYFRFNAIKDIDWEAERDDHRLLRRIEKKLVDKNYATANIYFDPTPYIDLRDRAEEFARPVPDVLYEPIGRKPRK